MGKNFKITKKQLYRLRELVDMDGHIKDSPVPSDLNGQNVTSKKTTDDVVTSTRQPVDYNYIFPSGTNFNHHRMGEGIKDSIKRSLNEANEGSKEYVIDNKKIRISSSNPKLLALTQDVKSAFQKSWEEFNNEVSNVVDFKTLSITDNNVEWLGSLLQNRILFSFSLDNSNGLYISTNSLQMDDEVLGVLSKLLVNYKKWAMIWSEVINNRDTTI